MVRLLLSWLTMVSAVCWCGSESYAQQPLTARGVFPMHRADLPPGVVGQGQLRRGGPLAGYFQPVRIVPPKGARVGLLTAGRFDRPEPGSRLVGMLIGPVYRLKVTGIPNHEGEEVYPTIELVNRLYPPPGLATKYPVPIHLSQEELEMALEGRFVTRVIYLENPDLALPVRESSDTQRVFDVAMHQDPLQAADQLGRPMVIVRIGSRIPDRDRSGKFLYQSPPFQPLAAPKAPAAGAASSVERSIERSAPIRRLPLPRPGGAGTRP